MRYRILGKEGLRGPVIRPGIDDISAAGLKGDGRTRRQRSRRLIGAPLDAGVNLSTSSRSPTPRRPNLKKAGAALARPREQLIVATKWVAAAEPGPGRS